jgi:hypothetical protein
VSQQFANLIELDGFSFPVYVSANVEEQAQNSAALCESAYRFFRQTFNVEAQVSVLVLSVQDWAHYAPYPVYGMPHILDTQTLIVAGQNNDFWKSLSPPVESLPPELTQVARTVYGLPDGSINYAPFFELLAVHELGHLFHFQASIAFPRNWLTEFFCNLGLHTYVATKLPQKLTILETFPRLVIAGGYDHLAHHTLADFERLYVDVGPQNYGWYQSQLHIAAKQVFDVGNVDVVRRLWNAFRQSDEMLSDEQLALRLRNEVHPLVERILTMWPPQLA